MMNPLATYLLNQQVIRLLSQQAIIGNSSGASHQRNFNPTVSKAQPCVGGSGVYFNDREVPPEMHVSLSSRGVSTPPSLPSGKPMPQPPKLLMTNVRSQLPKRSDAVEGSSSTKRKPSSLEQYQYKETKRARHSDASIVLTSEEEAFIEAALALTSVRSSGRELSPKTSPTVLGKSPFRGALPPPPFSLSNKLEITKPLTDRVAKSA